MLKVFIADDDSIIRQGLRTIIEKRATDYQIVGEAADGELAIEGILNQKVDLLITDIKMPIMDGVELIRKIRESGIKIKIIVLSGFDEYKYVRESLKLGAVDYLLKPVQRNVLLELLEKVKKDIENEAKNELQNRIFSDNVSESVALLKEKYLLDLIRGSYADNTDMNKKLEEYGFHNASIFQMAAVGIDKLYLIKRDVSAVLEETLVNMLKKQIESAMAGNDNVLDLLTTVYRSDIIILFVGTSKDKHYFENVVTEFLSRAAEMYEENEGFTITAGISEPFESLGSANIAYNQAVLAMQRRFYEGKKLFIQYIPEDCCYNTAYERQFRQQIEEVTKHIELAEPGKTKSKILDIMEMLRGIHVEPEQYREVCSQIVSRISGLSQEFSDAFREYYVNEDYDMLFYIRELNTCDELKEYVSQSFFGITQKICSLRAERSKKIIEMSKEYIQKHFKEDLSLNSIAERAYLNPFYFSNLFKNETGKSFTDFLIETRINEAKKLLARPELKVYEIGLMVGYEEPVSFNRAFKKVVGLSPAEYRKVIK